MEGLEAKSCSSLAPKLQSFQGTLGGAAPGFVGEADQFLAGFGRCGDPLAEGNAQSLPAKDEIAALWIYARHPPRARLGAGKHAWSSFICATMPGSASTSASAPSSETSSSSGVRSKMRPKPPM